MMMTVVNLFEDDDDDNNSSDSDGETTLKYLLNLFFKNVFYLPDTEFACLSFFPL